MNYNNINSSNALILSNNPAFLTALYGDILSGIAIYNKDGELVYVNDRLLEIFQIHDRSILNGSTIYNALNIPSSMIEKIKMGEDVKYEFDYDSNLIDNNKISYIGVINLLITVRIIRNSDGEIESYLGILEDNTLYKKKEHLLSETSDKMLKLLNSVMSGIEIYNCDGILVDCNECELNIFGIESKGELLKQGLSLFNNPNLSIDKTEGLRNGYDFNIGLWYNFDLVRANNYYRTSKTGKIYIEVKGSQIVSSSNQLLGYIIEVNDITEKKQQELQMKELHNTLDLALNSGGVSAWIYNIKKREFSSMLGKSIAENGLTFEETGKIMHPDDYKKITKLFKEMLSGKRDGCEMTVRFFDNDYKGYRYYESEINVRRDLEGKIKDIIGTQKDITEKYLKEIEFDNARKSLDLVMEYSNVLAWDYDVYTSQYRILYGNQMIEKHSGIGNYHKNIHPDDSNRFTAAMNRLLNNEIDREAIDVRIKNEQTGIYHTFEHSVTSIKNKEGEVISLIGTLYDITERNKYTAKLEEWNNKTKLVNDVCGVVPWDYNPYTHTLISFSSKALFPYIEIDVNNNIDPLLSMVHPEDRKIFKDFFTDLDKVVSDVVHIEIRILNESKTKYSYLVTDGIAIKDNNGVIIKYTGIDRNISKWVDISHELEKAKASAEESNKLKSAFLANMSHEIRTPLNAIVGFSELMQSCDDPDEKREYMKIINTNNELLLRLIGDILDLSKIESNSIDFRFDTFYLSLLFRETYATLKPRCEKSDVKLFAHNPYNKCVVTLDKNRLLQIWMNFINNAVKYTRNGSITIGYDYIKNGIKLFVKDTGIGISQDNQKKLFKRFEKLDNFAQGSGLGLSICKAICERLGGEIGVKSELGKGSTFWAWLPCKAEIEYFKDNQSSDDYIIKDTYNKYNTDSGIKNILIAEDNDSNYLLLKAILKGHNLTRAINGEDAVKYSKMYKYDAIFMDIKMPIMGGLEATRKIREFDNETLIVAVTANAFDSDKEEALRAGCNSFVSKPLSRKDIESVIYKS